jgi:hypothetical protein
MRFDSRRPRSSWRVSDARALRPELWFAALGLVGMLLVEVGQSSRMTELGLQLDQTRSALVQAQARLEFVQARFERRSTRAELAPLASQLGLAPADAQQVVALPAEYLADRDTPGADRGSASVLAWAERASRALVPEATARVRAGN